MMNFDYSFSEVSQDKRVRRTEVVGPDRMPEIVGADMRVAGGLKLHPGFKMIRRLAGFSNYTSSGSYRIKEAHGFSVIAGDEEKVHGIVYRASTGSSSKFVVEYYDGGWRTYTLISSRSDATSTPWSIVTVGRFLYLYIRGMEPIRWYLDPEDTSPYTVVKDTDTGPGEAPAPPGVGLTFNTYGLLYNGGGGNEIPITEFPYFPEDAQAGAWDDSLVVNYSDLDVLTPGGYAFAIQYENSITGLKSNLSKKKVIPEDAFVERVPFERITRVDDDGNETETIEYRSVSVKQQATVTWTYPDKFDTAYLYRTIATSGSGNAAAAILYLEGAFSKLEDPPETEDSMMLDNIALVLQDRFDEALIYDENPPYGGVAYNHQGSVFVSEIAGSGSGAGFNEIGEVRWSSFADTSPELFPPGNRYVPRLSADNIINFFEVSGVLHGASLSRQFEVSRSGRYAVFRDMHEGYGVTSQWASTEWGPNAILATPQGLKEIRPNGEMLNINAANLLMIEEWGGTLSSLCVVYDPVMGVIMTVNTSEQKALCLWTETRQISELWYMPFAFATEGVEPGASTTVKRALFVTPQGVLYRLDDQNEKTFTNHTTYTGTYKTMLEIDGHHHYVVTAVSGTDVTVRTPDTDTFNITDCRDAWVYFPTEDIWRQVVYHTEGATTITLKFTEDASGVAVGSRAVLDPVMFKVMGHALGDRPDRDERGAVVRPTRFNLKGASMIGCVFEGVSGNGLDQQESTFKGRMYRGLEAEPIASATPRSSDGVAASVIDTTGGTTIFAKVDTYGAKDQLLFPAIEVVCPDIDFVLLAFRVSGSMDRSSINVR